VSLDFDDRVKTGNVHSVWWVVLRNDTFSGSSTATNTFRIATSEFVDTQSVPPYP